MINTYLFCENTYLIHTHFPPKYIPFTYLWAPKIHTFLSFSASFLAQPMTRRQWRKTEWKSRLDWVRGVQFLRGKSFVLGHSKAFWASSPFQLAGKHSCEGSFTYLFDQIHTFYIPNFWKRYVYIPRYVNTYPTWYPVTFLCQMGGWWGGTRIKSKLYLNLKLSQLKKLHRHWKTSKNDL